MSSREELEEMKYLIQNGENSCVEFKEEEAHNDSIVKEFIAFLNFKGGTVFFGVSDSKEIKGVNDEEFEERIMNLFYQRIFPSVIPDYREVRIDGRRVVSVTVDKGIDKPYYTKVSGKNCYYIRYGSTSREASREELIRLFQASGTVHYEITPVPNASLSDLDLAKMVGYFERYRSIDLEAYTREERENILKNSNIALQYDTEIVPTVAGMLLFGRKPKEYLSQTGIRGMFIGGNDLADRVLDHKFFQGDIFSNLESALDYIKLRINFGFEIEEEVQRRDILDYPMSVLRELLVNAVAHRDYTVTGSTIAIIIYKDRIEFKSPGSIPSTLTVEKMKQGIMYHRNPLVVQFLYDSGYVERLGRGIRNSIRKMNEFNGTDIEIISDRAETVFKVFK